MYRSGSLPLDPGGLRASSPCPLLFHDASLFCFHPGAFLSFPKLLSSSCPPAGPASSSCGSCFCLFSPFFSALLKQPPLTAQYTNTTTINPTTAHDNTIQSPPITAVTPNSFPSSLIRTSASFAPAAATSAASSRNNTAADAKVRLVHTAQS